MQASYLGGIWVIFLGQLKVGLFDFCLVGGFGDSQNVIEIFLAVGRKESNLLWIGSRIIVAQSMMIRRA
jgi:hypothetical protein